MVRRVDRGPAKLRGRSGFHALLGDWRQVSRMRWPALTFFGIVAATMRMQQRKEEINALEVWPLSDSLTCAYELANVRPFGALWLA